MPPGYLTSKIKDETFEHAYTAISIVTFKKDLITEINETLVILNEIIILIYENHSTYISNLGSGYLPYIKRDEKIGLLTFKNFLKMK